ASTRIDEIRARVERGVQYEADLIIAPAFFHALRERWPEIGDVEVRLKRGRDQTEMTRFRYDVVLRVGGGARAAVVEAQTVAWGRDVEDVAAIRRLLDETQPGRVTVLGIPNARVAGDAAALTLLERLPGTATVEQL